MSVRMHSGVSPRTAPVARGTFAPAPAPPPPVREKPPFKPAADQPSPKAAPAPLTALWRVNQADFPLLAHMSEDRMIAELERLIAILERDSGTNANAQERLSIKEGLRFLQEHNRRLRMLVAARQPRSDQS